VTVAATASLYRTLGVEPSASPSEVRRAYRSALRRLHPDSARGGSVKALGTVVGAYRALERTGALVEAKQAPAEPLRHVDVYA
jgi:curved DNA-binding protein CbpA